MAVNTLLLALLLAMSSTWAAQQPQVTTTSGELKFLSSDNQDIVFQPGLNGRLMLNGVAIKDASSLKGTKGDAGAAGTNGAQGAAGTNGGKGEKGVAGSGGTVGAAGPKGDVGPMGTTGSMGQKGETGTAGQDGAKGAVGSAGPPGPMGSGSAFSSQCAASILPSCPFWLNTNTTNIPASGNPVIRFATSGFSALYHPDFDPTYSCVFTSSRQTVRSADVPITPRSAQFYVVDCVAPQWTFGDGKTFSEKVNVSLWFLDSTQVLFAGRPQWQQATFFVGTYSFSRTAMRIMQVKAAGLDVNAWYICRFSQVGSSTVLNAVNATQPASSTLINCYIPIWTTSSAVTVDTNVSLWTYASGKPANAIPFLGQSNSYTFNRCSDGVKNGGETDVDCGSVCKIGCGSNKNCSFDGDCSSGLRCDSTTKKCATRCTGWMYKGICLKSVYTSSSSEQIPAGCTPYSPALNWQQVDFRAICGHFGRGTCSSVDTDTDGGRCTNYKALLAYENQGSPDVWVNRGTFAWNPVSSGTPNCVLIANLPGTIVYACL